MGIRDKFSKKSSTSWLLLVVPSMASRFTFTLQRFGGGIRPLIRNVNKKGLNQPRIIAYAFQKRLLTTEDVIREESKQSWFDWFFRSKPDKVITDTEKQERAELLERVQACYYTKPPAEPGIEHFEEAFNLLIKYDDWRSVEALWRLAEAQHLEFDDDLLDKIEDYLLESRDRRWFE